MKKKESPRADKSNGRQLFLGLRGVVEGYSRRTLILILVGNILLAGAVIGGGLYYYRQHHKPKINIDHDNGNFKRVEDLKSQQIPKDPFDQVIYYSQLAQNYSVLKEYDDALKNFLTAQSVVEHNNLQDSFDFYRAIGDTYLAKKDANKAKEYYQKEIDHLKAYQKEHPDNADNQKLIDDLQAQVQKL